MRLEGPILNNSIVTIAAAALASMLVLAACSSSPGDPRTSPTGVASPNTQPSTSPPPPVTPSAPPPAPVSTAPAATAVKPTIAGVKPFPTTWPQGVNGYITRVPQRLQNGSWAGKYTGPDGDGVYAGLEAIAFPTREALTAKGSKDFKQVGVLLCYTTVGPLGTDYSCDAPFADRGHFAVVGDDPKVVLAFAEEFYRTLPA